MIRLFATRLEDLDRGEAMLCRDIPAAWLAAWQSAHPTLHRPTARMASLAGIRLLALCGGKGELSYTEDGKPLLTGGAISITHTDAVVISAISEDHEPIGLDAEEICGRLDEDRRTAMAERWFSAAEREQAIESEEAFYRIWTRKEAYVKRLGTGLRDLSATDTTESDLAFATYRLGNSVVTLAYSKRDVAAEEIVVI